MNTIPSTTYHTLADLPFVTEGSRRQRRKNWVVAKTDSYAIACARGHMYAAQFAKYLKDNPDNVGMSTLNKIIEDMDFSDEEMTKGYMVGFFAHIERLIHFSTHHLDPIADANEVIAECSKVEADRAAEAFMGGVQ